MRDKPKLWYITTGLCPFLAVATSEQESQCNTGPAQCCNQSGSVNDPAIAEELGLLGVDVRDVNAIDGLDCTPASVITVGSRARCSSSPPLCEDDHLERLVAISRSPIGV